MIYVGKIPFQLCHNAHFSVGGVFRQHQIMCTWNTKVSKVRTAGTSNRRKGVRQTLRGFTCLWMLQHHPAGNLGHLKTLNQGSMTPRELQMEESQTVKSKTIKIKRRKHWKNIFKT